jgi:translation elongation factor EF-1alpha
MVVQLLLKLDQLDYLQQRFKELEIENQRLSDEINWNSNDSHNLSTLDPPHR